jgi:hypothetical protein
MKIRMFLHRPVQLVQRLVQRSRAYGYDRGMATAEYAVGLIAACGFAGLLVAIMKSSEMKTLLFGIIRKALSV